MPSAEHVRRRAKAKATPKATEKEESMLLPQQTMPRAVLDMLPLQVWPLIWSLCGWLPSSSSSYIAMNATMLLSRNMYSLINHAPDDFYEMCACSASKANSNRNSNDYSNLSLCLSGELEPDEYYIAMPPGVENADECWRDRLLLGLRKSIWIDRMQRNAKWLQSYSHTDNLKSQDLLSVSSLLNGDSTDVLFARNDVVLVLLVRSKNKKVQTETMNDKEREREQEEEEKEEEEEENDEDVFSGEVLETMLRQACGAGPLSRAHVLASGAIAVFGNIQDTPAPTPVHSGCLCLLSLPSIPILDGASYGISVLGLPVLGRNDIHSTLALMCASVSLDQHQYQYCSVKVRTQPIAKEMPYEVYYLYIH